MGNPLRHAALAALLLAPTVSAQGAAPQVGQLHPDLRLTTIDGSRVIALSELRGAKVLLIEFASW